LLLTLLAGLSAGPAAASGAVTCPERRAQLSGQTITASTKLPDLTCADLHGAVFDGVDLVQKSLKGADAQGASFRGVRLGQADLTGANLRDTRFEDVDLDQVHARGADLRGADLSGASLIQADLSDADLRGAKISWLRSIQANTSGVRVDLTNPGTFQLSLLAGLAGLLLLVGSVVRRVRGRSGGAGSPGVRAVRRLAVYAGIVALVVIVGGMVVPLLLVEVLYPVLAGAVLVVLSGLVVRSTPDAVPAGGARVSTPRANVPR
jgi:hypothetical protein